MILEILFKFLVAFFLILNLSVPISQYFVHVESEKKTQIEMGRFLKYLLL